jgi:GntR family transcriptional regulator
MYVHLRPTCDYNNGGSTVKKIMTALNLTLLTALDPASPIPLYHQIEMDLRRLIRTGEAQIGDILPPETQLAEYYGVGRQTVRMALARLVDDGWLTRYAGRGTFVRQPDETEARTFYLDRSFSQQMEAMGRRPHSKVISTQQGTIDANAPLSLRSQAGAPYFYLLRLRFGDDEPIGLQATTLITTLTPGIESHDFNEASLYTVLFDIYRLKIARLEHTISAVTADETQAALLNIQVGAPLLIVNTTAALENGAVIEATSSHYRADKYEYSTTHRY